MTQDAADRSKRVLAALVREFITSGEPVASSVLVTAAGLGVSSATVRSILARLEEEGFVQQPHTSAGRIPTDRGYRFYVDLILDTKRSSRLAQVVEAKLRKEHADGLLDSLLPQVSHMVSQASGHIGFAVRPAHESAVFDRVDFIPLGGARVLVVIVARGGHVIQKVLDVTEPLTGDDLRHASNYLNAEFSGLPLHRAREAVLERIHQERLLYDALLSRAMRLATSTFADLPGAPAIYIEGAASLLEDSHGLTLSTLQTLLYLIEEKQRLVRLLNEYIDGPGLTVVIGAEHPAPHLRSFSLIASTYGEGDTIGTIDVVDGAAQAVARVLRDPN